MFYDYIDPETGEINAGGIFELNQVSFELYVPYYERAKEIIIYNNLFDELAQIEVSSYSKEKPGSISGKVVGDLDSQDKEEQEEEIIVAKEIQDYWWFFLIVLVILILVLISSLRKRK